jgi:dTDP-4-amino-4,6-dideoxygalactose transaminase
VDPDTWIVDAARLESAIDTARAEAIVLVSPFGLKCDFSAHLEVAQSRHLAVIIDSAAGLGVTRDDVESSGGVEIYSMHATKPFGIGEGGVVFCNETQAERIRSALNFGFSKTPVNRAPWGINGKMSEFHAAIGLAVLRSVDERLRARKKLAHRYAEAMIDCGFETLPPARDSTWQMFPMLAPSKGAATAMIALARELGMECRPYYSPSLSTLDGVDGLPCPVSEDLAARMVCAPLYSSASGLESDEMIDILRKSARSASAVPGGAS